MILAEFDGEHEGNIVQFFATRDSLRTVEPHARSLRHRVSAALDDFTEQWIGWTFPPVERAIADADWRPDKASDYCQRCGDSVGEGEATADGCSTCGDGAELDGGIADGVIRLGPYLGALRGWIQTIKFQRWEQMGTELGRLLGERIYASGKVDLARAVVVPIPMPWQRRLYRGVDHAEIIAHGLARELGAPQAKILARTIQPPQVSLTPSERKRAGSRGMYVARRWGGWPVEGEHLILVDDVRTTGSTLKAASRLLKRLKPAKVICAVAAVSDSSARRMRRSEKTP